MLNGIGKLDYSYYGIPSEWTYKKMYLEVFYFVLKIFSIIKNYIYYFNEENESYNRINQ